MTTIRFAPLRVLSAAPLALLIAGAANSAASAHVSLANAEAVPGSHYKAVLQVPHGCDGEATTSVRVQIPEGVVGVKPMPKPGWTLTTTRGAYAKAYDNHGRSVSEGVKEVVWSGGSLADEHFDEFIFSGLIAVDGSQVKQLYFPTVQTCAKGEAAWTEIPSGQQTSRDLKKPAPALRLVSNTMVAQASGHDHAAASSEGADTVKVGDLTVALPWTRATPSGAKVAGGYLAVTNNGKASDTFVGGSSDIAGRVEIHEMAMEGGVMKMRPLNAGIEIKPGQTVELKPGGLHMMFLDLKRQLKQGETVKASLKFEKAGSVDVTFKVGAVGGSSSPSGASSSSSHHQH